MSARMNHKNKLNQLGQTPEQRVMLAGTVDSLDAIQQGDSTFEQRSEVILGQDFSPEGTNDPETSPAVIA